MTATVKDLALGVATVAASAAVQMTVSPFGARGGREAVVAVLPIGSTSDQAGNIQGSSDGSSWSNLQAYDAADGPKFFNVPLYPYMRVNNASGTTVGTNFQIIA